MFPNLAEDARGVLYSPFIPGVDPRKGTDLFADQNKNDFQRDMRLLKSLGATTAVLYVRTCCCLGAHPLTRAAPRMQGAMGEQPLPPGLI